LFDESFKWLFILLPKLWGSKFILLHINIYLGRCPEIVSHDRQCLLFDRPDLQVNLVWCRFSCSRSRSWLQCGLCLLFIFLEN